MQQSQRQAVEVIARVLDGAALPAAMAAVDLEHAGPARALVQELAYGTLRHYGTLDALQRMLAAKPLPDRDVALLVDVALYQIAHTRAPAFAIVDQAVEDFEQLVHVGHVEADGRFFQQVERRFGPAHFADALVRRATDATG